MPSDGAGRKGKMKVLEKGSSDAGEEAEDGRGGGKRSKTGKTLGAKTDEENANNLSILLGECFSRSHQHHPTHERSHARTTCPVTVPSLKYFLGR